MTQHVLKVCLKVSNKLFSKGISECNRSFFFFFKQVTPWARSVGTDGLPCLVVAAIVWLGLIFKVLVHVHVVVSIGGVTGQIQGCHPTTVAASAAGLVLHPVCALNDRDGRFRAGWVAGAVWGQVWGWCGCRCHGYGAWVNSYTAWAVAERNQLLRPEKQREDKSIEMSTNWRESGAMLAALWGYTAVRWAPKYWRNSDCVRDHRSYYNSSREGWESLHQVLQQCSQKLFIQNHKCQLHCSARGKERRSPKSRGFIYWGSWISAQNFIAIHPMAIDILYFSLDHSGGPTNTC